MFWEEAPEESKYQKQGSFFQLNPAVRFIAGMALGIAFGYAASWSFTQFFIAFTILSLATLAMALFSKKNHALRSPAYWACSIACGLFVANNALESSIKRPALLIPEMQGLLNGRVETILRKDSTSVRCIVSGYVDANALPRLYNTRTLLSISRLTDRERSLTVGSLIAATVQLHLPQPATLPGEFDEDVYCRSLNAVFAARATAGKVAIIGNEDRIMALSHKAALSISDIIDKLFAAETAPIIKALLLGDKSQIPPKIRQNFALTGVAHVIAVSGLHVGVLSAILWLPIAFVPNRWLRAMIMITAIAIFVLISGLQPSAIRAAVMAAVLLLTRAAERRATLLNAVCFAAILMLLADASLLYSAGFQMSFAAVAGLGVFLQPFRQFFRVIVGMKRGILAFIGESLAVTFAASGITSVLVAAWFGIFSIVSPLANIIIVPLSSIAMIFGATALLFYPASLGIASLFAAAAQFCIEISIQINEFLSSSGFASVGASYAAIAAILSLLLAIYIFTSSSLRIVGSRIVLCCLILLAGSPLIASLQPKDAPIIAARRDMIVLSVASSRGSRYALLLDRKPHQEPKTDFGLAQYLATTSDSLIIVYRGNISEWNAAQARRARPIVILPMNEDVRRAADSFAGEPLAQIQKIK